MHTLTANRLLLSSSFLRMVLHLFLLGGHLNLTHLFSCKDWNKMFAGKTNTGFKILHLGCWIKHLFTETNVLFGKRLPGCTLSKEIHQDVLGGWRHALERGWHFRGTSQSLLSENRTTMGKPILKTNKERNKQTTPQASNTLVSITITISSSSSSTILELSLSFQI